VLDTGALRFFGRLGLRLPMNEISASRTAIYITGEVLHVDGGMHVGKW
jgi:hypothetical protein